MIIFMKKLLSLTSVMFFIFFIQNSYADNGIYIATETGYAIQTDLPPFDYIQDKPITRKITDHSLNAYRYSIGYNHDFIAHPSIGFGLNIGFGRYGKTIIFYQDGSNQVIKSDILDILFAATFHINHKIDLLIKAGGVNQTTTTINDICPEAAVTGAYRLPQHFSIIATYAHVFNELLPKKTGYFTPSVHELMLGLQYTFSS